MSYPSCFCNLIYIYIPVYLDDITSIVSFIQGLKYTFLFSLENKMQRATHKSPRSG